MFKNYFKTRKNYFGEALYPMWDEKRIMTNEDMSETNQRIDLICEHLGLSPHVVKDCETKLITKKEAEKRNLLCTGFQDYF
jgi:hypothetical protein